jgi:hypothetical protein
MEIKEAILKVEESAAFKKWKEKHKNAYLASVFTSDRDDIVSINYYDDKTDKMYSFSSQKPEAREEDFLRKSEEILPLNLEKVTVTMEEANKKAGKVAETHYSEEKIVRTIRVLQKLDGKQIWNITFITINYKTINVRIDSSNGEVIAHNKTSLIDFVQ